MIYFIAVSGAEIVNRFLDFFENVPTRSSFYDCEYTLFLIERTCPQFSHEARLHHPMRAGAAPITTRSSELRQSAIAGNSNSIRGECGSIRFQRTSQIRTRFGFRCVRIFRASGPNSFRSQVGAGNLNRVRFLSSGRITLTAPNGNFRKTSTVALKGLRVRAIDAIRFRFVERARKKTDRLISIVFFFVLLTE